MRIAIIDPFYDVSHSVWSEGLRQHSSHEIEIYSLSAVHWKWKMASGALTLAKQVNQSDLQYDLFIATDMLDVGLFKSLLSPRNHNQPVLLYFHENQLTYPWSDNDPDKALARDHHYAWINFTSAIVSDQLCFNSNYHQHSFLTELPAFISQFPSSGLASHAEELKMKSTVLPIGLDLKAIEPQQKPEVPIILWNHRWESDKNPDLFFKALQYLRSQGMAFELIICGKEYPDRPPAFDRIKHEFLDHIIHWGFVENREQYWGLLCQASISLVTSNQDFFGISVVEAIHAGCIPMLANRLAYPEHIPPEFHDQLLYGSDDDMYRKLSAVMSNGIDTSPMQQYVYKYDWSNLIHQYDELFTQVLAR